MKKILLLAIILSFLCVSTNMYYPNDWTVYSYTLIINDIDGDLNYVYAAANTGLLAIDKFTNVITPIMTFRNNFHDFPIKKIIVDLYNQYNVYFSARDYIYHYNWFTDELIRSKVNGINARHVNRMGINNEYLFVEINDKIYKCLKIDFENSTWERELDTTLVKWKKDNTNFDTYNYILPFYRDFNNKNCDFTCFYEDFGHLWVGTNGAGIYKINLNSLEEEQVIIGVGGIDNRALSLDSTGHIWIAGLRSQYITRYNTESSQFEYFPTDKDIHITDNSIACISSSNDYILFGTNMGQAFFYSLKDKRFREIDNEIGSIIYRAHPLDKNRFLVSNNFGYAIIDVKAKSFTQKNEWHMPSIIDIEVFNDSIFLVSANTLYSGSKKDLILSKCEFDFPTFNVFQYGRYKEMEILQDNAYIHIRKNGIWESFPVMGFFGDIYSMTYDDKNVWISGQDGVGRFRIKNSRWEIFNRYNSPMPKTFTFNVISHNGYLYGSTNNGFFKFFYSNPMFNE